MKILVATDQFPPLGNAGAETISMHLAKGFEAEGHEVHLLSRFAQDQSFEAPFPVHRLNNPFDSCEGVNKIVQNLNPDIIHVHNVQNNLGYKLLKQLGTLAKTAITLHDSGSVTPGKCDVMVSEKGPISNKVNLMYALKTYGRRHNPLLIRKKRNSINSLSCRIAVSDSLGNFLKDNGIHVNHSIHNGLPLGPAANTEQARKLFKIDRPTILFAGRISHFKGSLKLAEALKKITFPVNVLVACEEGSDLRQFQEHCPEHVQVLATGWLKPEKMNLAYAACDAVVIPSICMDSFPTVILEAMRAKRPVVASCFGGGKEAIEDKIHGRVINPLQIDSFAQALDEALINSEKSAQYVAAAHKRFLENFQLKNSCQKYLEIFDRL